MQFSETLAGVEAAVYVELKVELTGRYVPAIPATGPSMLSGEPGEPGWAAGAEEIEIDGLWIDGADMLKGIDRKGAAYKQLRDNLLEVLGAEAEDALVEAAR